jgi:hypothetical protein
MKVFLIQRTDTNEYALSNGHWGSKSARTFTRLSDLSCHLNHATKYLYPNQQYRGVPWNKINLLEFDLDKKTKAIITMETYMEN